MKNFTFRFTFFFTLIALIISSCLKDDTSASNNNNNNNNSADTILIDIDSNVYRTVKIGKQIWMAENLKVEHFRNGDPIQEISDFSLWQTNTKSARCSVQNDNGNKDLFGYLYNGNSVLDSRNIAPKGWHIPSLEEWKILIDGLGGITLAGSELKDTETQLWAGQNADATNSSKFTALPAGVRLTDGMFAAQRSIAQFWSKTPELQYLYWIQLNSLNGSINIQFDNINGGLSIRCIKD